MNHETVHFLDDGVTVITELIGRVITDATGSVGDEDMTLTFGDNVARFYHSQDCCESVEVAQIDGDLKDLVGSALTMAEVVVEEGTEPKPEYPDSWTWSVLKLATVNGYVTVRWLGESSGYYSESISMRIEPTDS